MPRGIDCPLLRQIPGEYWAEAVHGLPTPTADSPEVTTETDVPHVGRVRFTIRVQALRHRRTRWHAWQIVWAERVETPST